MRKIYIDVIKNRILKGELLWLLKRALQYLLIHFSFLLGRPLCGPILGTVLTNYTCNYRCKMCDLPERGRKLQDKGLKELSTSEFKQVLKDFATLGTSGIGFTGGEPLLRDDIFELMEYTRQLGMVSHLNTNGSLLDEKRINRLLDCGADSVNISLDGARAETHDKIRGYDKAFEKAVDAIKRLDMIRKKKGIPIRIKTVAVVSEDNIDEIPDLIRLVVKLNTDCIEFIPEQNFTASSCSQPNTSLRYSDEFFRKLDNTVNYLLNVKDITVENSPSHLRLFKDSFKAKPSPLTCYAGYNSLGVDCYGFIYPCMPWFNWEKSIGNIKNRNLKEFWYSADYNCIRKTILKCKDCYINCQAELNILFNRRIR